MKIVRTGSKHYLKADTATLPKGTIMFHYAVEGTKEELASYEEAKGTFFSTIEDGDYAGKPFFCSSKHNGLAVGESITVELRNNTLTPIESDEELMAKADKASKDRQPLTKRQVSFLAAAAKAGATVAMPE
jgi:hypothetical protein